MAKDLKVGERVRIYSGTLGVLKGTVVVFNPEKHWFSEFGRHPESVLVEFDKPVLSYATGLMMGAGFTHPGQCRRLKPKPRREWPGKWMGAGEAVKQHYGIVFVPHRLNGNEADTLPGTEATVREVRK